MNLSVLLDGHCGQITALYQPDLSGVNVTDQIIQHCVETDDAGKTCHERVTNAIVGISNECNGRMGALEAAAHEALAMWLLISKVTCVKDGNTLCFPVFRNTVETFTVIDSGAPITDDILDSVCVPCVHKVLDTLATWGVKEFVGASSTLKIACVQRNGEYCLPKFLEASTTVDNFDSPQNRDLACHECTVLVAYRLYWQNVLFGGNETQRADLLKFLQFSGFICQQNQGQYCTVILQQIDYSGLAPACLLQIASPATAGATCPNSDCQRAFESIKSQAGCCLGTWMNYLRFVYMYYPSDYPMKMSTPSGDVVVTPDQIQDLLEDSCQVPIGPGCASRRVRLSLVINNIIQGWYLQNQAWLQDKLKELVAFVLAIDPDTVMNAVTSWDAQTNTVVYTANVVPYDEADVDQIQRAVANTLQMQDDTNSIISNIKADVPELQAADFDSAITVAASSVVECNDPTDRTCNFACGVGPSLSLVFALALLLSYFN
eukprot:TRINITY_DN1098_c0_g2_i4.p1 TRINITY_DN1098_c0_g2~~TRINITY_DN1098_c0_g2_i4.p1  ORF type:complete len:506 (+),score=41.60 TRINITY_DN1098_c0_g2_i4:49-1518(+)